MTKRRLVLGVGLALAVLPLQAAIIDEDFNNDTVGGNPTASSGASLGTVVDSGSTPADPFGGSGNRSMYINDGDNIGWDAATGDAIANGTATFTTKIWMTEDATHTDGDFYLSLGSGTGYMSSGEMAVRMFFRDNDVLTVYDGTSAVNIDNYGTDLDYNEIWNVKVDMNLGDNTWSLTINNHVMSDTVAGSTFDFYADNDINSVYYNGTGSSGQNFLDDVKVIPEPGTMGLLGLATMGILLVRRLHM